MDNCILQLDQISYSYEDHPPALKEVSLSIYQNQRIAVLGSNGAGKSTFFLCCNGVLEPDSGSLLLHGEPIKRNRKSLSQLRKTVGIVFQDPNQQFIGSSVKDDISFGPMNLGLSPEETRVRVEETLAEMNLIPLQDRPPHYLSGGEKKRLSIAGVLAMHPELILFDEPTASLDVVNIEVLEHSLDALSSLGKTLVVSTHDMDFVWRWANRVVVFHKGQLVADAVPEVIFSNQILLKEVGLKAPMLFDFSQLLKKSGHLSPDCYPRTMEELTSLLP